jgi:hypothetical protein
LSGSFCSAGQIKLLDTFCIHDYRKLGKLVLGGWQEREKNKNSFEIYSLMLQSRAEYIYIPYLTTLSI